MTESEIKYALALLGKLMLHFDGEMKHNKLDASFKVEESGRCYRITSVIVAISPAEFEAEKANRANTYHGKAVV